MAVYAGKPALFGLQLSLAVSPDTVGRCRVLVAQAVFSSFHAKATGDDLERLSWTSACDCDLDFD